MRPIRLEMTAFGPYVDTETVDFRKLGNRAFFLISGPTGAGKSSIFDAMCFALYNASSGSERTPAQMRNQRADTRTATRVEFTFQLGSKFYRVTRQPEQELAGQRVGGLVKKPHTADIAESNAAEGPWQTIAARPSEVADQVQRLLGLEVEQFRQVLLLPQDRFREVLTARAEVREKILETLFGTQFYSRVAMRLEDQVSQSRAAIKTLETQIRTLIQSAGVETEEELAQRIAAGEATIPVLTAQVAALKTDIDAARVALEAARSNQKILDELAASAAALARLEQRADEIARLRARLAALLLARELQPLHAVVRLRAAELDHAIADAKESSAQVTAAQKALEAASASLAAAEKQRPRLQEIAIQLSQLEGHRTRAARIPGLQKAVADAEARETLVAAEVAKVDEERRTANEELESARLAQNRLPGLSEQLAAVRARLSDLNRWLPLATQVEKLQDELRGLREKKDKADADLTACEKALRGEREALAGLEEELVAQQSARLAADLVEGRPCPVCGSTHHPNPARHETGLLSDSDIKAARQRVADAEVERDAARVRQSEIQTSITTCEATLKNAQESLHGADPATKALLTAAIKEAKATETAQAKELQQLQQQAGTIPTLEAQITRLNAAHNKATEDLATARTAVALARRELAATLEELPEEYHEAGALENRIAELTKERNRITDLLQKAAEAERSAANRLAQAQATHGAKIQAVQFAEQRLDEARRVLSQELINKGFTTPEEFMRALADIPNQDRLEADITAYDRGIAAARDRHARAAKAAEGVTVPDIKALEEQLASLESALAEATKELTELRTKLGSDKRVAAAITTQLTELTAKRHFHENVATPVANAVRGQGATKISLQRFVLGAMLDEVLMAATRRLLLVSKGRYKLQRRLDLAQGGRGAQGLDVEVFDEYSGQTRPVTTLSGGEGFLTALSLALGLADVVQQQTGAVRLETIFIDEGFGGLDPESLDLAMRALLDLNQSGRLVGVISHVEEMKAQIDTRLEVIPGKQGSTTKFIIP